MKKVYKAENIDCANCAAEIESNIRKLDGIKSVSLSFITGRLVVEFDGEEQEMTQRILKECRRVEPDCVVR